MVLADEKPSQILTDQVLITPEKSRAANYAFDVTPARLVTGFITEKGICAANAESVLELFPEKK
jgi:methylthioribose-1-phosphate isomerase